MNWFKTAIRHIFAAPYSINSCPWCKEEVSIDFGRPPQTSNISEKKERSLDVDTSNAVGRCPYPNCHKPFSVKRLDQEQEEMPGFLYSLCKQITEQQFQQYIASHIPVATVNESEDYSDHHSSGNPEEIPVGVNEEDYGSANHSPNMQQQEVAYENSYSY
jgi:hypothetical protein